MAVEGRSDKRDSGRIRYGMVGGGQGAFIGAVHRLAARMDARAWARNHPDGGFEVVLEVASV